MNDWGRSVLEQYKTEIMNVRRGRGALLCETASKELLILQEYKGTAVRLEEENEILRFLAERGGMEVDYYIPNKEGSLHSQNADGTRYVLKKWYDYPECNVNSYTELSMAVRTLAKLHMLLRHKEQIGQKDGGMDYEAAADRQIVRNSLLEEYERHNKELRRIRRYIRSKRKKTAFELCIMESFEPMFEQAQQAVQMLIDSEYPKLYRDAVDQMQLCHGSCHQHNVLIKGNLAAIVNFQHFFAGVQIVDLYQFMRKVLEKHNWNIELGNRMLEDYNRILPISKVEREILHAMFLYPEKYWKQMNFYYNSNKAWIPQRSIEKLKKAAQQSQARLQFLDIL